MFISILFFLLLLSKASESCMRFSTMRLSSCIIKLLLGNEQLITVLLFNCMVAPSLLFSMWFGIGIRAAVLFCANDTMESVANNKVKITFGYLLISLFHYVQFVECTLVSACIFIVLTQCPGKIVLAGEILLCAHVQIVVSCIVQDAFYCLYGRYTYWAGR